MEELVYATPVENVVELALIQESNEFRFVRQSMMNRFTLCNKII